jgi:hypothetical protein
MNPQQHQQRHQQTELTPATTKYGTHYHRQSDIHHQSLSSVVDSKPHCFHVHIPRSNVLMRFYVCVVVFPVSHRKTFLNDSNNSRSAIDHFWRVFTKQMHSKLLTWILNY